jgi:hemolysin activation/secretion protein
MLCWPWGGIFGSAELWYRIVRTADKKGVLQVTPFVDIGNVWTNSGPRATLEANTLLSGGLGLRWQYGERWNAGGGGEFLRSVLSRAIEVGKSAGCIFL